MNRPLKQDLSHFESSTIAGPLSKQVALFIYIICRIIKTYTDFRSIPKVFCCVNLFFLYFNFTLVSQQCQPYFCELSINFSSTLTVIILEFPYFSALRFITRKAQTQCSSIFSINIPYPRVGSFTSTWVTAPTSFPSWMIGLPLIP